MRCQICDLDECEDEAQCALFWNLDQFSDFPPDDEEDTYELYEEDE